MDEFPLIPKPRPDRRRGLLAILLATVFAGSMLTAACGGGGGGGGGARPGAPGKPEKLRSDQADVTVPSQGPTKAIPEGFLGISMEFTTLPLVESHEAEWKRVLYEVTDPGPVTLPLRLGGDSAQHVRFEPVGAPWAFTPTKRLVDFTARVISASKLQVIVNVNTISSTHQEAAGWMRDLNRLYNTPSGGRIVAFEIGNEPDIYNQEAWKRGIGIEGNGPNNPAGVAPADLPKEITARSFARSFTGYANALASTVPGVPVIAPALAEASDNLEWIKTLLRYRTQNLRVLSAHTYPYSACAKPGDPTYPTLRRILSESATAGMARTVRPAVKVAHKAGLSLRLTEINSVTCGGLEGVSDTFATALWAPDALFEVMKAGVEGVNLHARVTSINRPFSFDQQGLETRPLLYGMILFNRMMGPGARLVPVRVRTGSDSLHLKVWAVRASSTRDWYGTPFVRDPLKVLVINKGRKSALITLHLPASSPGFVQRLLAPSASSTSGVTLEGQQLNHQAFWQGKRTQETVAPSGNGAYVLRVRGESAAILTVPVAATTLPRQSPTGPAPLFGYE
jgi:hypothetical protein